MAVRRKTRVPSAIRRGRPHPRRVPSPMIEGVQQIWLAGMGAIAKAQKGGPAAFQEAVAEGFRLLNRSRASTEKAIRDAFEAAQQTMQSRVEDARGQAQETWDNLETLFQSRVHKALQQLGVPSAAEIRVLTARVAQLDASVKKLLARRAPPARRRRVAAVRAPR